MASLQNPLRSCVAAAIMPYLFQNNIQNALSTETDAKKSTNLYIK